MSSLNNVMGEKRLLHVVQEQKHRDSELAIARRKRLEVEDTNRDLEERYAILILLIRCGEKKGTPY